MFINYTKPNCHTLATPDGKEFHHLRPGWQEFPKRIWDLYKDDPEIKRMVADGDIVLMAEKVQDGKKTKTIGQDDQPVDLKDLPIDKAIKIAKETLNRDLLQRWADEETRHKVKRILESQIKELTHQPEDDGSKEE